MTVVPSFNDLLQPLASVMTAPTFGNLLTMLTGWVFAAQRTVTGMILAADAVKTKHHSAYHRLFAAAQWSLDELGLAVFSLMQRWLAGTVLLAIDDTLCRKRGRTMFGAGMHHDPLISSRHMAVTNWGHSWVIVGVVLKFPFADRHFCLPVLLRLYRSKQTIARRGGQSGADYRTRPQLAVQMLLVLCHRYPHRHFHALADTAYGGQSVLKHLPVNTDLTSRMLLDGRLVDAPAPRQPGQRGRTALRGKPLPSPRQMLQQRGRRLKMNVYGRHDHVRFVEAVARPYHVPQRTVRVVAVQSLTGSRSTRAFYSTAHEASAQQVIQWYALRWSIEQTIQESKGHLGFEQPQGWTRKAVERTAPTAMLLYSLIVLWFAQHGHQHYRAPERPWYLGKRQPCFADMLTTLRVQSVRHEIDAMSLHGRGSRKIVKTLVNVIKRAA